MRRKSQPASATGLKIVARPLEEPLRRTVPNAAEEPSIVLQRWRMRRSAASLQPNGGMAAARDLET
jgi:hypothetical protein